MIQIKISHLFFLFNKGDGPQLEHTEETWQGVGEMEKSHQKLRIPREAKYESK